MISTPSRIAIAASTAILLVSPGVLHAVRPVPAAATPAPKEEAVKENAPVQPYELKNRSSFNNPGDGMRIPFWPVGWTKRAGAAPLATAPVEAKLTIDEKNFKLSSILLGNPSLAVINGRPYTEGELIRMPKGGQSFRIRVQRINDGSVVLEHDGQKVTVPLRRMELNQHKDEDTLLDPNR